MTDLQKLITDIDFRFSSGNDVPVSRATLKKEEWELLREKLTLNKSAAKVSLGISHKVVFEVPSKCTIECKTSPNYNLPAAIVFKGTHYVPGYFFHSIETGTLGPFDTMEKACECLGTKDYEGWIVIVPTIKVEV